MTDVSLANRELLAVSAIVSSAARCSWAQGAARRALARATPLGPYRTVESAVLTIAGALVDYEPDKTEESNWRSPDEVIARGADDCEGWCVVIATVLAAAGIDPTSITIRVGTICRNSQELSEPHAVVAVDGSRGPETVLDLRIGFARNWSRWAKEANWREDRALRVQPPRVERDLTKVLRGA